VLAGWFGVGETRGRRLQWHRCGGIDGMVRGQAAWLVGRRSSPFLVCRSCDQVLISGGRQSNEVKGGHSLTFFYLCSTIISGWPWSVGTS
jgi:hypothetical protein